MKMLKHILALLCLLALAACGGGGGSAGTSPIGGGGGTGTGGTTTGTPSVLLSISSTTVTSAAPATIRATVLSATGTAVAGQVVTFTTTGSIGALTPASALTGSDGVATVQISPASATANGADLVTAKTTVGTVAATGTIGFQVVATSIPASGNPTITATLSSTTVSNLAPATFTATVKDAAGVALSGQVVKFSSADSVGAFTPVSALTDANGVASSSLAPANGSVSRADLAVAQVTVGGTLLTSTAGFTALAGNAPSVGAPSMSLSMTTTTITTSAPASVTATVRDASGNGLLGQVVKFTTVDGLGTLSPTSALTDATGAATVVLSSTGGSTAGADQVVATATVSGTALQASQGFQITVGNTTAPGASTLSLALSSTSVTNTGNTIVATATTVSSTGQVVPNAPVTFSVDSNATFLPAGTVTGANGTLAATVGIGTNKSNRIVTVTATSGSLTATASFAVTGAKLASTPVPLIVPPGTAGYVDFQLTDANSTPITNQSITVQAGSLGTVNAMTGTAGEYRFNYIAPATIGSLDITAIAGGVSRIQTVLVQNTSGATIPPVTVTGYSASVSANPTVISTNLAGSTTNRTEVRALFVGADNAPVANMRVRFDLAGDASSVGGTFSTGDNIVYSDANGIATTAYISGTRSSPTNGVTIRACYGPTDFATCSVAPSTVSTTITIASDPLSVTIGSNGSLYLGTQDLTYQRRFVIQVVDAAGAAKSGVTITPSLDIERYYKGRYTRPTGASEWSIPNPGAVECFNEDINRNGVLDVGEDVNHNGSLQPRKADVAVSVLNANTTDSSGMAVVQIEYPKNVAGWARVKITVGATGVSGSEGRATWTEWLPVDVAALTATASPPFIFSPYGIVTTDQSGVGVTFPDGTAAPTVITPCNNPN